jgi:transposase InsO family protein
VVLSEQVPPTSAVPPVGAHGTVNLYDTSVTVPVSVPEAPLSLSVMRSSMRPCSSRRERARALPAWLDRYNRKRPHRSIGRMPPMARLAQLNANNVAGAHS